MIADPLSETRGATGSPRTELREQLAALAHAQWSGWMRHLFSKLYMLPNLGVDQQGYRMRQIEYDRWLRQVKTPYADLSEAEKESDRKEADRVRQQHTRLTNAVLVVSLHMANNRPFVALACLCEKVLTEKDGVLTLVRVVDQFTVEAPPDVVERLNPHLVLTLVLSLKANGLVGKHQLSIHLHGATKSEEPRHLEIDFPDRPLSGANVVVQLAIGTVKNFGEKRFDVSLDGELLTSVPFRVVQAPVPATDTPA